MMRDSKYEGYSDLRGGDAKARKKERK